MVPEGSRAATVAALENFAKTIRVIESIGEVEPSEWDLIVTSARVGHRIATPGYPARLYRNVPLHLAAIVLLAQDVDFSDIVTDADGKLVHRIDKDYALGIKAVPAVSIPSGFEDLAKEQLAATVAKRKSQFGVKIAGAASGEPGTYEGIRPYLWGPNSLVYAMEYERAPGSPVWLLPEDLANYRPWFAAIFADLHRRDPATYDGDPEWIDAPEWMTPIELEKLAALNAERDALEESQRRHAERVARLNQDLEELRSQTIGGERVLLSGQGFPLQAQVLSALSELGFEVEDMDKVWEPKEPREDYRIRDAAAPDWMVIGDATGTAKGVKGAKLMTVERYVTKYIKDEPEMPVPGFWLIANHFADREPGARPADLIRGDELGLVEDADSLVLDTVALFRLLVVARERPEWKAEIRAHLRSAKGQFTQSDAERWIKDRNAK